MKRSFNLIEQPWIPCVDSANTVRLFGIRQVLVESHRLRAITAETPLDNIALTRLLLAVLHAAYRGPAESEEWSVIWRQAHWHPETLNAYLDQHLDRFDMFHPQHPFFQAPDNRVKPKSIAVLRHEYATGNNATLFDHSLDDIPPAFTPDQAARTLITAMAFGLAGLSGLDDKFTSAPCAGGAIFLAQGETLFQTLMLNWTRYDEDGPIPAVGEDRPAWEMSNPLAPFRTQPLGYLDYLTWHNRKILLLPEEIEGQTVIRHVTVAPGLRLEAINDPMKHWMPSKDKDKPPVPLRFGETRAVWRDSVAILESAIKRGQAPHSLEWMAFLVENDKLDRTRRDELVAAGMASDQAKVLFYRTERLPLPLVYLSEDGRPLLADLHTAITWAESVSSQLWGATRTLAFDLLTFAASIAGGDQSREPRREDLDQLTKPLQVEERYWARLNNHFHLLLNTLPSERQAALQDWARQLRSAALDAFNTVSNNLGMRPPALHAWVIASAQLSAGIRKVLGESIPSPSTGSSNQLATHDREVNSIQ